MVAAYGITNVRFEPFVSPDEYPLLLKEADIGLLSLKADSGTPTVPGKFFGFLAAKLPVVAFLNKESEGHRLIAEAGCGYACVSDDVAPAAVLLRNVIADRERLHTRGERGYEYVKKFFSKNSCIDQFERMLHV